MGSWPMGSRSEDPLTGAKPKGAPVLGPRVAATTLGPKVGATTLGPEVGATTLGPKVAFARGGGGRRETHARMTNTATTRIKIPNATGTDQGSILL